eukprot:COSAG01_NODE_7592_length_3135_cov_1.832016_2_plen_94_part_00
MASLGAELAETAAALRDAQVIFGIEAPCSPLTRDCQCFGAPAAPEFHGMGFGPTVNSMPRLAPRLKAPSGCVCGAGWAPTAAPQLTKTLSALN